MLDQRKEHRNRTYLGGQVAFNKRYSIIDCLVRNLSQDGAKVEFAHPTLVPSEFDLIISSKGDSRRARIVWRQETQLGVIFIEREANAVLSVEAARRIQTLQNEREALAKRVAELSEAAV